MSVVKADVLLGEQEMMWCNLASDAKPVAARLAHGIESPGRRGVRNVQVSARLAQFRFAWPQFDATFTAGVLRWLMAVVALAGCLWFLYDSLRRRGVRERPTAEHELTGR